jgi:hypothetical protein
MDKYFKIKGLPNIKSNFGGGGDSKKYRSIKLDISFYNRLLEIFKKAKNEYKKYQNEFSGLPIVFFFNKLLSKTDRFKRIIKEINEKQIDSKYVFNGEMLQDKFEITYLLTESEVDKIMEYIKLVILFIEQNQTCITNIKKIINSNDAVGEKDKQIAEIFDGKLNFAKGLSKTAITELFIDFMYIENVKLYLFNAESNLDASFVRLNTLKKFDEIKDILMKKGIELNENAVISKENLILNIDKDVVFEINKTFPFLINVASSNSIDMSNFNLKESPNSIADEVISSRIDAYDEVPDFYVGVIDSYANVSPSWKKIIKVDNRKLPPGATKDFEHGTYVSTIIAGNDIFNNELYKDGLGIFKVKHFGIVPRGLMQMTTFIKSVEEIIATNRDIEIWNLSIEINMTPKTRDKRISELGRQLDRIQKEYNVLIVISSGNNGVVSFGSDTLLGITVGSLYKNEELENKKADYSGQMNVFNLFKKPNCYDFGNDIDNNSQTDKMMWLIMDSNNNIANCENGTSFAAPLITRKCAYLKYKHNLNINEIRAYINLESEMNEYFNKVDPPNVLADKSNKFVLHYSGEAVPGETSFNTIKLPFQLDEKGKNYRLFLMASSISYMTNTNVNVGDDYSGTELTVKIMAKLNKEVKSDKRSLNCLQPKTTDDAEAVDSDVHTQHKLLQSFKKYNPNKVMIDNDIVHIEEYLSSQKKFTKTFNNIEDELNIEVQCIDLFSSKKAVKFGFVIFLYEISNNSLRDFEVVNDHLIEEDKVHETTSLRVKVKS